MTDNEKQLIELIRTHSDPTAALTTAIEIIQNFINNQEA